VVRAFITHQILKFWPRLPKSFSRYWHLVSGSPGFIGAPATNSASSAFTIRFNLAEISSRPAATKILPIAYFSSENVSCSKISRILSPRCFVVKITINIFKCISYIYKFETYIQRCKFIHVKHFIRAIILFCIFTAYAFKILKACKMQSDEHLTFINCAWKFYVKFWQYFRF